MDLQGNKPRFVAFLTDFGSDGPYLGQMRAVLAASGVTLPIIDLFSDLPAFNSQAAAYLLAALGDSMPEGGVFVAVVDPGVGGERRPLLVQSPNHWYVGPDNGLLSQVIRRQPDSEITSIHWRPDELSASFHGRDLFAPVAAMVCNGEQVAGESLSPREMIGAAWSDDLAQVIYIDHFGNAFTGIRASALRAEQELRVNGHSVPWARTFCEVSVSTPFWYENSIGLVEIAVNQGRADRDLGLEVGSPVVL
jgi:S-adenosylmethionine hydrolase